jgi:hypothetical protein
MSNLALKLWFRCMKNIFRRNSSLRNSGDIADLVFRVKRAQAKAQATITGTATP